MLVTSLYVPENCLQLEKFPAHILWNKEQKVIISLTVPDNIILKEIYNITSSGNDFIYKNEVLCQNFDVNGYVGFVFESMEYHKARMSEIIKFTITSDGITEYYNKEILLFRQNIKISDTPDTIKIIYDDNTDSYYPDKKIHLKNVGDGTAKVVVQISKDQNVTIQPPDKYQEFIAKFRDALFKHFGELSAEYTKYANEINRIRDFLMYTGIIDAKLRDEFIDLTEKLESIFSTDDDFSESFARSFTQAYLENFNIIADIEQFSNFLNSVNSEKIIIENALNHIVIPNGSIPITIELLVTDVANNTYPTIQLTQIQFTSEKDAHIPLYLLFEMGTELHPENTQLKEVN